MNTFLKRDLPSLVVIVVPILYLGYIWNTLPDKIPVHWNIEGKINGWGNKTSLYIPVLLPLITYLLFLIIPKIDPKNKLNNMGSKYHQLKFWFILCMSAIALYTIYSARNQSLFNPNLLLIIIGLLFAVLGNYFPSIKPSYFMGIRTPWTLESEAVWRKTHQLGGKLWFIGGLAIVMLSFLIPDHQLLHVVFLIIVGILVFLPIAYSFLIFKKVSKTEA